MAVDENGYYWSHSLELPDGTVTPGDKTHETLLREWQSFTLPPLPGKTVLDIGASDGYFSFAAEASGASRVVALDHFHWSLAFNRIPEYRAYEAECRANGERPEPFGPGSAWWDDVALPGKHGFDMAHRLLGSAVESVHADFMACDLESIGTFDVVFFLGALYHLREPFTALERLRQVTKELAVIETAAIALAGTEDGRPLLEFLPEGELNGDPTNWFVPNHAALHAMLRRAGFTGTETVAGVYGPGRPGVTDLRFTVQAIP
jgi:tRNA (mo5U34)-methyltransferase